MFLEKKNSFFGNNFFYYSEKKLLFFRTITASLIYFFNFKPNKAQIIRYMLKFYRTKKDDFFLFMIFLQFFLKSSVEIAHSRIKLKHLDKKI